MSVDIIFPELFLGKADLRRYSEKFRYILSLLGYTRLKRICVRISKNFFQAICFSLSTVVCNKKMCCLKNF